MDETIKRIFDSFYYEPFLGWLYLYGCKEGQDPIELNKYLDTAENRAALQSQLGAREVNSRDWKIV